MKKALRANKRTKPNLLAPTLRFSPTAWAKLVYLRDRGDTEVGGFGISSAAEPLLVQDFQLVKQTCTSVTVCFDDLAVADYFDEQVDQGLRPSEFGRLWIHTHPGNSPEPSWIDWETFARVFSATDWALMFILARGGQTYARLGLHAGIRIELIVPVAVDYSRPFAASDFAAWEREYQACVRPAEVLLPRKFTTQPAFGVERSNSGKAALPPTPIDDWMFEPPFDFNQENFLYDR
jgi:hypothetical protein